MSMSLSELSKLLRKLDICMLGTHGARGTLAARPMSNNKDVEYDGTSHFFTWADSRMARDIRRDPGVLLTFTDPKGVFVAVQGTARITTDKKLMAEHWVPDVERWFADGVETAGICMIIVDANRISYWTYEHGDGEITMRK
ncbi:pyridoxamine 5'-phosphate oxidase family protein [Nostocoides australiense]|nr:pyridoxamine 5'-phosphate oxidase family protein [Actinomycetota bacterium]MCB1252706.1 pyridoxamine 5'-phosphate oxidase family protein [Austwickia sp.]HPF81701.1 pyridoxamine 5'-phosphate oxidase family protein [Tetrasphaera australiensis]HRW02645.1 pyridoxamine 5'-phosphate oxidase family protein [Tetrasphaera sp.]